MITKAEAIQIAKEYASKRNRRGVIDETSSRYKQNFEIHYGKREGETRDVWVIASEYDIGYNNIDLTFINIDAETGKVLFTLGPHSCVEYREAEGFE